MRPILVAILTCIAVGANAQLGYSEDTCVFLYGEPREVEKKANGHYMVTWLNKETEIAVYFDDSSKAIIVIYFRLPDRPATRDTVRELLKLNSDADNEWKYFDFTDWYTDDSPELRQQAADMEAHADFWRTDSGWLAQWDTKNNKVHFATDEGLRFGINSTH